jgi:hypothetical protein
MNQRYFTLEEARASLPRVRELVGEAQELKRKANEKISLWGTRGEANFVELAVAQGQVEFLFSEVRFRLETLLALGCVMKDIDQGLVDFPARIPGYGEGYFCWKNGESDVRHWHGLTEGFLGRKPIVDAGAPGKTQPGFRAGPRRAG